MIKNLISKFFIFTFILFIFPSCLPAVKRSNQVCFHQKCVNVEAVQKPQELMRGLQFRKSLGREDGMLFIFSTSGPYSFWMKDTLIPLDMIWMDYARRVIYIASSVPPCTGDSCPQYTPMGNALYILEVNGGYTNQNNIKIGDEAQFHLREKAF